MGTSALVSLVAATTHHLTTRGRLKMRASPAPSLVSAVCVSAIRGNGLVTIWNFSAFGSSLSKKETCACLAMCWWWCVGRLSEYFLTRLGPFFFPFRFISLKDCVNIDHLSRLETNGSFDVKIKTIAPVAPRTFWRDFARTLSSVHPADTGCGLVRELRAGVSPGRMCRTGTREKAREDRSRGKNKRERARDRQEERDGGK